MKRYRVKWRSSGETEFQAHSLYAAAMMAMWGVEDDVVLVEEVTD